MPQLACRFYSQKFPELEDTVMVKVRSIADMGAYVSLLEYNNIEGMILLSELSRRRIRSINKLLKVGKTEPVVVIRVDREKGYIDLSKRRVNAEDVERSTEKFSKAKAVNSILRHVAELLEYESSEQLEELYKKTAWRYEEKTKKHASSYEFFKQACITPSVLDECELDDHTKEVLLENIKRKLTLQAVKIRSDIEVACYEYEGIDAVKDALRQGLSISTPDIPIRINLIAPPVYVMTTQTPERTAGLEALQGAIEKIETTIKNYGGIFTVQMAPRVVTDLDEEELARKLEALELENAEISGDDDDEDDEDEGSEGGDAADENGDKE